MNVTPAYSFATSGVDLATGVLGPDALVVEPNPQLLSRLLGRFTPGTSIIACSTFKQARITLHTCTPRLLVTNLRLDEFNGLHLVVLTGRAGTRSVVYNSTSVADLGLASEIRRFGAFYETETNLAPALPAYLRGPLPERDRRLLPTSGQSAVPYRGRRASDAQSRARRRPRPVLVPNARPHIFAAQVR